MEATDVIRLPDLRADVRADVREVVREFDGRPQVFLRVKLSGWYFPERAEMPFLLVGDVVSRFVVIARDGASATAYFDRPLPRAERVSFGYGRVITWDFDVPVSPDVEKLDRGRLPKGVRDSFTHA